MPYAYVFVRAEEAERLGLYGNKLMDVHTFLGYGVKPAGEFPFTPVGDDALFCNREDARRCREMAGNPGFVRVLVYDGK